MLGADSRTSTGSYVANRYLHTHSVYKYIVISTAHSYPILSLVCDVPLRGSDQSQRQDRADHGAHLGMPLGVGRRHPGSGGLCQVLSRCAHVRFCYSLSAPQSR